MGAAARHSHRIRRTADLCLAQLDHVLAEVVLFLRPAEEEFPRGLRVPRARGEGAAGASCRSHVESKIAHIIQIRHRDEVEAPITDWLHEAYDFSSSTDVNASLGRASKKTKSTARKAKSVRKRTRRKPT
jgi:hypothetical protein